MKNDDSPTITKMDEETRDETNSISIKLPQFWPNSPATWFIQAESQFSISRVNSETSRYHHVIASLPQDIIESIIDFVQQPPNKELYTELKKLLIQRHSLSVEKRIERIVSGEQLGDRKPSEFYRSLTQLAGTSGTISEQLVRKLWLRRLPQTINLALIPQEHKDIADVLKLADQIWEATQISHVSSIAPIVQNSNISHLEQEIAQIKQMISNLNLDSNKSGRFRSKSRSKSRNRSQFNQSDKSHPTYSANRRNTSTKVCWYHSHFGNSARRCITPCSFSQTPIPPKN